MADVGGFAGSSNWLGAHAGEWVLLRGAATLWDLVYPWSSFSKGMETGGAASLSLALGSLVSSYCWVSGL